ncbi:hypothetical protein [Microterricola pindariensis]|uniref:Uncharacterized protein n=1 Tax=Microterricola pindariensis TaxID=478010 RepID=A0ABX5AS53_9MICO|nr:hypothetical protein [Microterricola pindariensis]PPL14296.1 hypothetical protein GY24_16625 [Microterricola pindariensis]
MTINTHTYQVRLRGRLDERWAEWFVGFTLAGDADGTTVLTGPVADQAALHGLLRRLGALGATLISVNELHSEPQGEESP